MTFERSPRPRSRGPGERTKVREATTSGKNLERTGCPSQVSALRTDALCNSPWSSVDPTHVYSILEERGGAIPLVLSILPRDRPERSKGGRELDPLMIEPVSKNSLAGAKRCEDCHARQSPRTDRARQSRLRTIRKARVSAVDQSNRVPGHNRTCVFVTKPATNPRNRSPILV